MPIRAQSLLILILIRLFDFHICKLSISLKLFHYLSFYLAEFIDPLVDSFAILETIDHSHGVLIGRFNLAYELLNELYLSLSLLVWVEILIDRVDTPTIDHVACWIVTIYILPTYFLQFTTT